LYSPLNPPLLSTTEFGGHYLKANHAEYYDRLMAIRERGDWEGWLRFPLREVAQPSAPANETARASFDCVTSNEASLRPTQMHSK
jgi:hypothetical protein